MTDADRHALLVAIMATMEDTGDAPCEEFEQLGGASAAECRHCGWLKRNHSVAWHVRRALEKIESDPSSLDR